MDGPTDGMTDRRTNNIAFADPYHAGKSCSKFGLIPPGGLRRASVPVGLTDRRTNIHNMLIAKAWR